MDERHRVRPERASGVPSTASEETPQAPDDAVGRFETANDPTGGTTRVRRRFRVPPAEGVDDALQAVLVVPGVARAAVEAGGRELVADIEPGVVSDDELVAAIGRGGIEVDGWDDEPIPGGPDAGGTETTARGPERRDMVDEQGEESFPASDAPSSWAGPPGDTSAST